MKLHTGPTGALQAAGAVPTLVRKTVTFTGGAGAGAVGTITVFTFTGASRFVCYARVTTTLADTVDGAVLSVGTPTATDLFFDGSAFDLDLAVAGKWLNGNEVTDDGAPFSWNANTSEAGYNALDENIVITIGTQAITSGVLEFYLQYWPLSAGASVVAA